MDRDFGDAIDERTLIALIKDRPEVYDHSNRHFKRLDCRTRAWNDIAEELNTTVEICKSRWKAIRHVLKRDFTTPKKKQYYLRDALEFYIPFLNLPNTTTTTTIQQIKIENESDSNELDLEQEDRTPWQIRQPSKSSTSTEIKSSPQIPTKKCEDVDQGFLFSLLPDLETLDSGRKRIFKEKVSTWLRELHEEMVDERTETNQHDYNIVEKYTNFEYINSRDEMQAISENALHDHIY